MPIRAHDQHNDRFSLNPASTKVGFFVGHDTARGTPKGKPPMPYYPDGGTSNGTSSDISATKKK
jgi:hypothetical protein